MENSELHSDLYDLVDINDVKINTELPVDERIMDYISQIKNPYRFKCDDIIINVKFNKHGKLLDDLLAQHLVNKIES